MTAGMMALVLAAMRGADPASLFLGEGPPPEPDTEGELELVRESE